MFFHVLLLDYGLSNSAVSIKAIHLIVCLLLTPQIPVTLSIYLSISGKLFHSTPVFMGLSVEQAPRPQWSQPMRVKLMPRRHQTYLPLVNASRPSCIRMLLYSTSDPTNETCLLCSSPRSPPRTNLDSGPI